jgi:hypothetical protein
VHFEDQGKGGSMLKKERLKEVMKVVLNPFDK